MKLSIKTNRKQNTSNGKPENEIQAPYCLLQSKIAEVLLEMGHLNDLHCRVYYLSIPGA